ncbi:type II secretion system protein GspM [Sphingomonas sp.]|jgi:general secretion pathway protein M|uniref:type II secretion system protein GspM n=1 Tax=Sphingomonas sp. TaxID=28214 RepID=UPI002627D941|nr:type II secretion system protein GspM [Sphingomonas sp.]MDK2768969.1 type II secretion system protein M [Sphingomonas sp.]
MKIERSPTIDAAVLRFQLWWSGLSPRERVLVGALGVILGGLVLVFGIVKPLQGARADAIADIRSHETLAARVRAAGTLVAPGTQPKLSDGPPVEAAQAAASAAGLSVTLAPGGAGATGQVAEASYEAVIGWIAAVERTTVLRARRVELIKGSAPGRVSASVEFGQ